MNTAEKTTLRILSESDYARTVRDIVEISRGALTYELLHKALQKFEAREYVTSTRTEPGGIGLLRREYRLTQRGRQVWNVHRMKLGA